MVSAVLFTVLRSPFNNLTNILDMSITLEPKQSAFA